jgi:hypothetical protein
MTIWRATVPACAALFLLLQGEPLRAQPADVKDVPGETAEMTDKARELYNQGSAALLKGRWGEAHANLLAAWSLKKHHQIAGNLGAAEMQLGRYREAAEHLAYYLREAPAAKQKERQSAQALLSEARKHIGALTIKVEPAGAEVLVDGAAVGRAPLSGEMFVDPGKRTIEARLEGFKTARATVEVAAGSSREVPLAMMASVEAKGEPVGAKRDPAEAKRDPAEEVGPPKRKSEPSTSRLPEARGAPEAGGRGDAGGPRKEVLIAGIAAGALGIGAGIVFAVVSNGYASEVEEQRQGYNQRGVLYPCLKPGLETECNEYTDTLAARDRFGNLALWSFVVGGALGIGAGAYVLATWSAKPAAPVRAVPVVTAHGGGLVLMGSW